MIPKTIHYVWFGNPQKPALVEKCIASWRKVLPQYEIKEWNETNSPINHPFVKYCLENKQWAYASDYVRLWALYHHGGVYLDTDMEVVEDFTHLLEGKLFAAAYEVPGLISAGLIASVKDSDIVKELVGSYNHILFPEPIPNLITKVFEVYPDWIQRSDVYVGTPPQFYPGKEDYGRGNCYTIHHFEASWVNTFRIFRLHYITHLYGVQNDKYPYSKIMKFAKAQLPALSTVSTYLWKKQLYEFQAIYIYETHLKGPHFTPATLLRAVVDLKIDFFRQLNISQIVKYVFKSFVGFKKKDK